MAELFERVDPERGLRFGLWPRRLLILGFALFSAVALWGVIGQRDSESEAAGPGVRMVVSAPSTVRGGLFFQTTIEIIAEAPVEHPRLVLDEGWLEGMQVNSIEPAAESESSRDGRLVLSYGALERGDRLKVWMQFQVDPTQAGRRSHGVELDDGTQRLARVDRELMVLP